jgi:hypothetical protein
VKTIYLPTFFESADIMTQYFLGVAYNFKIQTKPCKKLVRQEVVRMISAWNAASNPL